MKACAECAALCDAQGDSCQAYECSILELRCSLNRLRSFERSRSSFRGIQLYVSQRPLLRPLCPWDGPNPQDCIWQDVEGLRVDGHVFPLPVMVPRLQAPLLQLVEHALR